MEKVVSKLAAVGVFLCLTLSTFAQTLPPLERTVSIELNDESTQQALEKIQEAAALNFGYRSDLVSSTDRLTRTYSEKTVRQILDDLFQGSLVYRVKGNYVILKPSQTPKETELIIEGYVFNTQTGSKIAYTSIYDSLNLRAALTDEFGHYSLTLERNDSISLIASKYGFRDTSILIVPGERFHNIYLQPEVDTTLKEIDSTEFSERLSRLKVFRLSEEQKATIQNIREKIKRSSQVSLLPTIGTNGKMSPSTTVDYSFNIIGGLNGGVNVLEIGGLFNADWDTVRHAQLAGAFNFVGGPQYGAQVAGFGNFNGDSFEGAQVAGFMNFTYGPFEGAQVSGFGNAVVGRVDGAQVSGFANYAGGESRLVQVSPVANVVGANSKGSQVSAVMNVAEHSFMGTQTSAVANYAMNGFIGSQFGLVNVAGKMTGSQVGFMNINDSITGVPFGFISFSRKGLHQLEVSANELTYLNLAFKTGTNQFYNSFIGGARFGQNMEPTWAVGYGVGTSVRGGKNNRIFFDLQSVNHFTDNQWGLALNNKLTISYQIQLAPKFQLAFGPSANLFLIDHKDPHNVAHFQSLAPYNFSQSITDNGIEMQTWVGGHVALRLF